MHVDKVSSLCFEHVATSLAGNIVNCKIVMSQNIFDDLSREIALDIALTIYDEIDKIA